MVGLRILADDLSGALDTAVCFAGGLDKMLVTRESPGKGACSCSTGARDLPAEAAAVVFERGLPWLVQGDLAFHKLDSRLRGHAATEIAAIRRAAPGRPIVIAPALPSQQRIVRSGRAYSRDTADAGWFLEPLDIAATLRGLGQEVAICSPSDAAFPQGISLWNTETDAHLDNVAAKGLGQPGTIFCGSSGLASALARVIGMSETPRIVDLARPMLLVAGTAHPRTVRQIAHLASVAPDVQRTVAIRPPSFGEVGRALEAGQSRLITPYLPEGLGTAAIADEIAVWLRRAAQALPCPGSLFVTGGETLDVLMQALGAEGLIVEGQFAPGIPVSRLLGGRWNRLSVFSKSGGFGEEDLLAQLVSDRI